MLLPQNLESDHRSVISRRWIVGLLALLTLVIYAPVRNHEFIDYDDNCYVYENALIRQGFTAEGVRFAFLELHGKETYWHPVTWLSHMLDCQLFGLKPSPHHLVNVLFHAANAVLLFLWLHSLTGRLWRSAAVAMLFAWHPLQVDTVAWIAERKNLLSALFWILSVWSYTRWTRSRQRRDYWAALALYAVGLMCKPAIVTLPCVLLLLDCWPLRRIEFSAAMSFKTLRALLFEKIPFFALTVASSFATILAHQGLALLTSTEQVSLAARVANALAAYGLYVRNVFWPAKLAVVYPAVAHQPSTLVVAGALVVVLPLIVGVTKVRSHPHLLVGWLWFLGTLVPTIGLVQVGHQAMADRFAYLPLIGLFIVVVWTVGEAASRFAVPLRLRLTTAAAGGVACLALTTHQVAFWKDSTTLFGHAAAVTEKNWVALNRLGENALGRGDLPAAITHFLALERLLPNRSEVQYNLALAYSRSGRFPEAETHYAAALKLKPEDARALHGRGFVAMQQGRLAEAQGWFQQALALDPALRESRNCLDLIASGAAQTFAAIARIEGEIAREPARGELRLRAAEMLLTAGRTNEAVAHYEKILAQQPEEPRALVAMAALRARAGHDADAIPLLERALATDPQSADAHFQFGQIRERSGHADQALAHYQAAVQSNPQHAGAWTCVGLLYARTGNLAEALDALERATVIQPENAESQLRAGLLAATLQRAAVAGRHLREAARLRPDWPPPLNALAWLLATHPDPQARNGADAVKLARRACELSGFQNLVYLDVLAAALAETGSFAEAETTIAKAIAVAGSSGKSAAIVELSSRLARYQAQQPFRQPPVEAPKVREPGTP